MSAVTTTHTAKDVLDYIKRQFGDESGVQVSDEDIIRWTNVSQYEIVRRNRPIKATSTAELTADTYKYTFPDNVLEVERIRVNRKTIENRSFQDADVYINSVDPDNTQTGQPVFWYEYGGTFMLWPVPDGTVVDGIEIFYIPAPTKLETSADALTIPDVYYNRLLEDVLRQAYELDENYEASAMKQQQFENNMDRQTGDDSAEATTYPRITVLPEDL